MKTIWIIDHYSSEPKYGGYSRQYYFANELSKRGYKVIVIAAAFSHFTHTYLSEEKVSYSQIAQNAYFVYVYTSAYQENSGRGRAKSMFSFCSSVIKNYKKIAGELGEPDVVTGCSVHPLTWVAAYVVAQKYKVRFCVEVRDLWPRIFIVSGSKSKYNPMCIFFSILQNWAYKKADRIIYSMLYGDQYICGELGFPREKTYLIGQPLDCERYDNVGDKIENLDSKIRDFIRNDFVCTFTGYYKDYEGVMIMLEAAKILRDKNLKIKMVFVGSGSEKEQMMKYVKEYKLTNVYIGDRITKDEVPILLKHSDVCMAHLGYKGNGEAFKFGASKNKCIEYLYSGACTIYAFTNNRDPVAVSGGGFVIDTYNPKAFADAIEKVYCMSLQERKQIGEKGRSYIKENNSVEKLVDKLEEIYFGEVKNG